MHQLAGRRARDHHKLYAIEGVRQICAAVSAKRDIAHLVVSPTLLTSAAGRRVLKDLAAPRTNVSPETFRQLSQARAASGIAAIVRQHWSPQRPLPLRAGELWLGVRRIDAPGNLGTILRTAHAFGATGLVCFGDAVDPFDPGVVRASMGGSFHLALVRTTHQALRGTDVRVLGAVADGRVASWSTTFDRRPQLVLLGNERKGLTPEELALCHETVRIPMTGTLSSLNVGIAAGVLLYEAWRARQS